MDNYFESSKNAPNVSRMCGNAVRMHPYFDTFKCSIKMQFKYPQNISTAARVHLECVRNTENEPRMRSDVIENPYGIVQTVGTSCLY